MALPVDDARRWEPQPQSYSCAECGETLNSKGASTRHMNAHICARVFIQNFMNQVVFVPGTHRASVELAAKAKVRTFFKLSLLARQSKFGRTMLAKYSYECSFDQLSFFFGL